MIKMVEECREKAEALEVEMRNGEKLEEELRRMSEKEEDLERRLLEAQTASTELMLKHVEFEEAQKTYEMLKKSKEVLEAELAMKVKEVTAREELIKKGTAMVEDLENRVEVQEDLVSKLEEAELIHAKELEAINVKLFE